MDNGISWTMGFLPGLSPSVTFITKEQKQRFPFGDKATPGLCRISGQTFPHPQTAPRAPLSQEKLLALLPVPLPSPRHGLSSPERGFSHSSLTLAFLGADPSTNGDKAQEQGQELGKRLGESSGSKEISRAPAGSCQPCPNCSPQGMDGTPG